MLGKYPDELRPGDVRSGWRRGGLADPDWLEGCSGRSGAVASGKTIRVTGPPRGTGPPLARRGEPGLHWPAAPRFPPPPVEPAMGGRPLPMCRPGRGSRRTVFVTGARNASGVVGRAMSARGRRDNAVGAPGRAKTTGRGPWGAGAPLRPRIRVTCPVAPQPDDSSRREPVVPRSRGILIRGCRRPRPGQAPTSAGLAVARRPRAP